MSSVSVVLVSWNTRELLDACLESLRPQVEEMGGDVWVVDNDSADTSADMVAERHPWVNLIRSDDNVGFARACNLVIPLSDAPYLFFFNPDATLDPGSLKALVDVMDREPRYGAMMPRLLNADGLPTHFVGRAPRWLAVKLHVQRTLAWRLPNLPGIQAYWRRSAEAYLRHSATSGGPYERTRLEGAALMVRRAALDRVGVFDPSFFCGYEETDLTIRMRAAGWKLGVTPLASARHWDQQSRLQWKSRPWEIPDGFYFVRKHQGVLGLRLHALRERRRLRYHGAAGLAVEDLRREQDRALNALLHSPDHPGYEADWRSAGPARSRISSV